MCATIKAPVRFCSQCKTPYPSGERFCPVNGGAIVEASHADDPLIGVTLGGRYLVRARLGQGGMGVVYEADHVVLDKRVAIKFLLDKYAEDREVLRRFHQEARTASRIGHENIVDIIDIGEADDGRSYIVMEYLDGADLSRVLIETGPMHPARVVHIMRQVLRGLAAAHDKGIVHRDMKPENVFLTARGDNPDFVKIMDFGISKVIDAHDSKVRLTETGAVVGTPIYMAPEQARAEQSIDHRADVYAVGVMFYELLCGRPPFVANAYLELVTQHLFDPPTPPRVLRPQLPEVLEQVVLKALAKDPADRFESADAMAAALPNPSVLQVGMWDAMSTVSGTAPAAGKHAAARPAVGAAPTATPARPARRPMMPYFIVGGAVLLAGAMVTATLLLRGGDEPATGTAAPAPPQESAVPAPSQAEAAPSVEHLESILEIDSRPQGARVLVDGTPRGQTPLTLRDVTAGKRVLRLELDGYQTLETTKKVREGFTESFFGAMARAGAAKPSVAHKSGRRSPRTPKKSEPPRPPTTTKKTEPPPPPKKTEPRPGNEKRNPYLESKPSPYN